MASIIYANGETEVEVPVSSKLAIYSLSSLKLYKLVGYPQLPDAWTLETTTVDGASYTTAAMTAATTYRVEASAAVAYYEVGTNPSISEPQTDITAADATFAINGLAAAQGGYVAVTGGTSSTAGNAGGAVTLTGGTPGATGVGGAATVTGGVGGATSGTGGAASLTGGAGTNGNAVGGAATVTGGAGQGTGAGGAVTLTGGASGAGATGDGADVSLVGGAAASTNGNGGSVVLTPGAKAGSGIAGGVFQRSAGGQLFFQQTAPTTKADGAETITAAQMINGIVIFTVTTGRTLTTPTGAAITAGCPADLAVGDAFLFHLITIGAGADDIATLTAGDGAVTFVGDVTCGPSGSTFNDHATWLFRCSGAGTWVGYRIG
jgi:hypothetical protein